MDYPFFRIEYDRARRIAVVYLNRPEKRNAMSWPFWRDLPAVVSDLEADGDVRAVVIAGEGKSFTTGLDIEQMAEQFGDTFFSEKGDGRAVLHKLILDMQAGMNAIAASPLPFVAAVHRHCIGGGLDLVAACDLRLCSADASFSLREAKVAIVADMGSLNRLPAIIGQGHTRMMALTARDFDADWALRAGLVQEVHATREETIAAATALAAEIAANPLLAVRGTKRMLNYVQDHTLRDSLEEVALWNAAYLDTHDFREMIAAFRERRRPVMR